jgi:hypothetical protein
MVSKDKGVITQEEMVKAILRSGYPLEQRVESVLEESGYFVTANEAYPDPVTSKSREIDICAITAFQIRQREKDFFFVRLICECENNQQPLVFFVKESVVSFLYHEDIKLAGIPLKILNKARGENTSEEETWEPLSEILKFETYHHYCKGKISTQYCSFTRKNRNKPWTAYHADSQHDSLTTLIFAVEHQIEEYYRRFRVPEKDEIENINIEFYYPVLILEGPLYTAEIKEGRLILEESNHIQYRKQYFYKGEEVTYQIDVLRESFLEKYLDIIHEQMQRAKKILWRNKRIVRESVDKLAEEMRKKAKGKSVRDILDF